MKDFFDKIDESAVSIVFALGILIPVFLASSCGLIYFVDYSNRQTKEVIIKCTSRFPVDTPAEKLAAFCGKFSD